MRIRSLLLFLFHVCYVVAENDTVVPATVPPAIVSPPQTPAPDTKPGKLNEVCNKTSTAPCEPNSGLECVNSGENNDQLKCRCDNLHYRFKVGEETKCYLVLPSTNSKCKECYSNAGVCIQDGETQHCSCPASRAGLNCETKIVHVTCTRNLMTVCFDPAPLVPNIRANDTEMYADGKGDVSECSGVLVANDTASATNCTAGGYYLELRIANKTEQDACGTINSTDSSNVKLSNRIIVANDSGDIKLSFIVYCSFQQFSNEKFVGIGIVSPNGNENGAQVDALISLRIVDRLGNPISAGSNIMVGDEVKFVVNLGKGDAYGSLALQRCTASSSPFMPDSTAETRALISNGCPVDGESTRNSWFFSKVPSDAYQYSITSKLVKMFKLSSSNIVYVHCTVQVCLVGQTSCTPKVPSDCTTTKKRSADHWISKRAASNSQSAYTYTAIIVQDPRDNVQANTIVYAVVFSVLIAAVVVALVVAAAMYAKKSNGVEKQEHPEVFAMPRLTTSTNRI